MKHVTKTFRSSISTLLILSISQFLLTSCLEEEILSPPVDEGVELPSQFFSEWKNDQGEIIFVVTSNEIQYQDATYNYEPSDVSENQQVYFVSFSSVRFSFKEGTNSNEIEIGLDSRVATYYKEVEVETNEPVNLPDSFNGHWYAEDGYTYSSYFIADTYIKTAGTEFEYTDLDVKQEGGKYTVKGTSSGGVGYVFEIEEKGRLLNINRNNEGIKTYWDTPAVELPSPIFTVWYSYSGALTYVIDSNQGEPYINYGNTRYFFGARDVAIKDDVFEIQASSSGSASRTFFIKSENENELIVFENPDRAEDFLMYWNREDRIPVISDAQYKKWFRVGASTFTYRLFIDEEGNHKVRNRSDGSVRDFQFNPEKGDISKLSEQEFRIQADGDNGARTFFIKSTSDRNHVQISPENSGNYQPFYNGTGLSIERVDYEGGDFRWETGKVWGEYKNGQHHASFNLTSRNEWGVYLKKSDGAEIEIDMWKKHIRIRQAGTSNWNFLFDIKDWAVDQ